MSQEEKVPGWFAWLFEHWAAFWRVLLLIAAGGLLTLAIIIHGRLKGIEESLSYDASKGSGHVEIVGLPDVIAKAQTVFVPAYSHVYQKDGKPFPLTTTLSIHNSDAKEPIVVSSVIYYGTNGKQIRQFAQQPQKIAPLGSIEFLVAEEDLEGGSGAKFIVKWVAEKEVHEPVIQTVMVGTASGQGLSFVTSGVVLEEVDAE